MLARWRSSSLLTLPIISVIIGLFGLIVVLWAVGPVATGSTRTMDDRISQVGELGTLPARRCEGFVFDRGLDRSLDRGLDSGPGDDGPVEPPGGVHTQPATVGDAELASLRPAAARSVARLGANSPRGPPLLV
jgi:hypothetical protein